MKKITKVKEDKFTVEERIKEMNLNQENYVCMANDLVKGTSDLKLNEAKLLRLVIMQNLKNDKEFNVFQIKISEFAELLNIDSSNIYRDARKMCIHILKEVVLIGDGNPKHKWEAFQWVSKCKYDGKGTITIQLHEDLKPYLLGLKSCYSQYGINNILYLKKVNSLRMFELINMELRNKYPVGKQIREIYLSIETIRKATKNVNSYEKTKDLTNRVVKPSIDELNSLPFGIKITYLNEKGRPMYVKEKGKAIGYKLIIKSAFYDVLLTPEVQNRIETFNENNQVTRG